MVTTFIITSNIFTGVPGGKPARSLKKGTTSATKCKWKGNIDDCIQVKKRKDDKEKQKFYVNEKNTNIFTYQTSLTGGCKDAPHKTVFFQQGRNV